MIGYILCVIVGMLAGFTVAALCMGLKDNLDDGVKGEAKKDNTPIFTNMDDKKFEFTGKIDDCWGFKPIEKEDK